jgi:ABC-2 type transport system permease protein
MLPVCLSVFVGMAGSSATAAVDLYPTVESRVQAATGTNGTPSLVALHGRIYDPESLGALSMWKLSGFGAAMVALLAIVVVIRHTRGEEEQGRLELVGSAVVGRQATLTAALLLALVTNLVLALLTAGALGAAGLPAGGSVAFGLAWGATGLAFSGVAAMAAQLTESSRAAISLSSALLAVTYVLRAIGDTAGPDGPHWATWLSPIGWEQQTRAFAQERWWVLLLLVVFAAVTAAGGFVLAGRRDLGAGLLPDRPGPAGASSLLSSALGLAWRLQRAILYGWVVAFALLGFLLGNIATNLGSMLTSSRVQELIRTLGGQTGLTDAFLAAELGFCGVLVAAYGIQAAGRLRSEEEARRAEPLLAAGAGRIGWTLSHLLVALGGSTLLLLVVGTTAGASYAAASGDAGQVGRVLVGALVQLPAAWLLTGIVLAAFGLVPRAAVAGWVALLAFVLIGEFGPLLQISHWILDLSPFAHTPRLPGTPFRVEPLLWMLLITGAFTAVGLIGARRRDMGSS